MARHSPTYAMVTFQKIQCKANFTKVGVAYTCGQLRMYIQGSVFEIQTPTHSNHLPQHDCLTTCVIAQQYSFAKFVSLRLHSRKQKFGASLEKFISVFFHFLKSRTSGLLLVTSGNVCIIHLKELLSCYFLRQQSSKYVNL